MSNTERLDQLLTACPEIIPFAFDLITTVAQNPDRPVDEVFDELRKQYGY